MCPIQVPGKVQSPEASVFSFTSLSAWNLYHLSLLLAAQFHPLSGGVGKPGTSPFYGDSAITEGRRKGQE